MEEDTSTKLSLSASNYVFRPSCLLPQGSAGTASPVCIWPSTPELPAPYPQPRTPSHPPRATSPSFSDTTAAPASSSSQLGPPTGPHPSLFPDAWGWGCPSAPRLPCSWLGSWDGPRLPGPARPPPWGDSSPRGAADLHSTMTAFPLVPQDSKPDALLQLDL